MISVTRFRVAAPAPDFERRGHDALAALGERPGFVRGSLARSTDDVADWVLVSEWTDVGSYRRALGSYEVKLRATPLLGEALDQPSSFEQLIELEPGGATRVHRSDRGDP